MNDDTTTSPQSTKASGLDGFFDISRRGSTVGREVRGGVVTFLTMAYIIVLNPLILGFVPDSTGAYLGGGAGDGSNLPVIAAGTALVLVGFLMMQQVKGIAWDDIEIALPAFLTIVLMPFTYSISAGIGAGFVTWVFLKVVHGKAAEVRPLMWVVSVLFVLYFGIHPLTEWLG